MKISKKLVAGAATALTFYSAGAEKSILSAITDNTKSAIAANMTQSPDQEKTISWEKAKGLTDKEKVDGIVKSRTSVDSANIANIVVDPKLAFIDFTYKKKYNVRYQPAGMSDIIVFYDSSKTVNCVIDVNHSLFLKNLEPQFKSKQTQDKELSKRLDIVAKIYDEVIKNVQAQKIEYDVKGEPIMVKVSTSGNFVGYFLGKIARDPSDPKYKAGKNNFKDAFFKIELNKKTGACKIEDIGKTNYREQMESF